MPELAASVLFGAAVFCVSCVTFFPRRVAPTSRPQVPTLMRARPRRALRNA